MKIDAALRKVHAHGLEHGTCICGKLAGHGGWLDCVEKEAGMEQMMITEVVETEHMKGTLDKAKWVSLTLTEDGVVPSLPKGVELLVNHALPSGSLIVLFVAEPDVNGR